MSNIIENVVMEYPDKIATVYKGIERTYKQFYERSRKIAYGLQQLNSYKGDRIAILLSNRPEYFELYFGIFAFGGIAVPLNTRLSAEELKYIIVHSGANTVVYEDLYKEKISTIQSEIKGVKNYINIGEKDNLSLNLEDIISSAKDDVVESEVEENDVAFLCYTSGTTGNPKGAMITHKNMTSMCGYQLIELPRYRYYVGMCLFPFFHIGVMMGLNKIALGMTCVFSDFSVAEVAELIEKHKINDLDITATQLKIFSNHPLIKNYDFTSLKTVSTGGGFSSDSTMTKFFSMFPKEHGVVVANIYGMTENTAHVMSNVISQSTLEREIEKLDLLPNIKASGMSAGKPIYGMLVKLVDKYGNQVPDNQVGEILVKGDTVLKGYWQEPEKTNEAVIDGWYYTGDLAIRLKSGDYFVVDRKKDMVLTGDENVYAAEIENILSTHPFVKEVAIIGVPHELYGEIVTAIVVPNDKSNVNEEELRDYCRGKIGGYKIPKFVYFVEQLPRNAAGKIMKHKLKENMNKISTL
ncbi:AMP-binding protein [Neobacillus sp.]|uniref:class I adenylate-forming enzyme family protein n=1 Tax=Neobacillus sp. TaxID=2675273 RepID=UPI00289C650E|nr:AMP-binding protein [Neobacillus sp.]